jgi:enoyl-CoA hydratase
MTDLQEVLEDDAPVEGSRVAVGRGWAVFRLGNGRSRNALDLESWKHIGSTFEAWATEQSPSVVIIRGNGSEGFSAGADITEFPALRVGVEAAAVYNRAIGRAVNAITSLPVPVIAMVSGAAVGGGCEIAAACDIRIASNSARFGIPVGRLGVMLGVSETQALLRSLGPARLKWLLFTGEILTAEQAYHIGLADCVVPAGKMVMKTVSLVQSILSASPMTIRAAKFVTDLCWRDRISPAVEGLANLEIETYGGIDFRDRVSAFLERKSSRG